MISQLRSLPLCSVETLKALSGAALFNTTHVLERCHSSRSPPSSRHTLPSGTSLLAPCPTSTRTQPGQAAATRATVRLPDVRRTATCQQGKGSAPSNIGKRTSHENDGEQMLGRPARRRGSRHVQAPLPALHRAVMSNHHRVVRLQARPAPPYGCAVRSWKRRSHQQPQLLVRR